MDVSMYPHQLEAIEKLDEGKILYADPGAGKSRTAVAYFFLKVCEGSCSINGNGAETKAMRYPQDLYIITTARKRDSLDWEKECSEFALSKEPEDSFCGVRVTIDSWNNIAKYEGVEDAFFIFDEQRLVGSGLWVHAFLSISKHNGWILLSGTPGDTWLDYIPVFVANGFYRNRTEFKRRHVVYNNFSKYPKVDHYVEQGRLVRLRNQVLVHMPFGRHTTRHLLNVPVAFDERLSTEVVKRRWNPFDGAPIRDIGEMFRILRRIANSDPSRKDALVELVRLRGRLIVFYNFDYELEILRGMRDIWDAMGVEMAEWNGHRHEPVPSGEKWVYLVQFVAGSEAWNCTETDTVVFYSLNYSYKLMEQASGRIDRLNTKFTDLYYYTMRSSAPIDRAILKALREKRTFNERDFVSDG